MNLNDIEQSGTITSSTYKVSQAICLAVYQNGNHHAPNNDSASSIIQNALHHVLPTDGLFSFQKDVANAVKNEWEHGGLIQVEESQNAETGMRQIKGEVALVHLERLETISDPNRSYYKCACFSIQFDFIWNSELIDEGHQLKEIMEKMMAQVTCLVNSSNIRLEQLDVESALQALREPSVQQPAPIRFSSDESKEDEEKSNPAHNRQEKARRR